MLGMAHDNWAGPPLHLSAQALPQLATSSDALVVQWGRRPGGLFRRLFSNCSGRDVDNDIQSNATRILSRCATGAAAATGAEVRPKTGMNAT